MLEPARVEAGKLFDGELVAVCYYHGLHVRLEAEATEVQVEPCARAWGCSGRARPALYH